MICFLVCYSALLWSFFFFKFNLRLTTNNLYLCTSRTFFSFETHETYNKAFIIFSMKAVNSRLRMLCFGHTSKCVRLLLYLS